MTPEEQQKFNRFHDRVVNGIEYLECPQCKVDTRVNPEEGPIFNCRKCKQFICFNCKRMHNDNMTCEELMNAQQARQEQQMKRFLKTYNVVACPRCKLDIMRKEGCRAMSHECAGFTDYIKFCGYCATLLESYRDPSELETGVLHFP